MNLNNVLAPISKGIEVVFLTQGPVAEHIKFCSNLFPSCIILRRIVHTLTLRTIVQEIYSYLKKKSREKPGRFSTNFNSTPY